MTHTYPSTRYLQQLTVANGWRPELIPDRHGRPLAVVVVRVGSRFTDAVVIEGEDRVTATRHRTSTDQPAMPSQLPDEATAVWYRYGHAEEVLAELVALPTE